MMKNTLYTEKEVNKLIKLLNEGYTVPEIARITGRGKKSLQNKINSLRRAGRIKGKVSHCEGGGYDEDYCPDARDSGYFP